MINIKDRREYLTYSLDKVAKDIGVSKTTLFRWEDDPTLIRKDYIPKLAKALKVSIYDLLDIERPTKAGVKRVPVIGRVSAGTPILADENIMEYKDMLEAFLPRGEVFFLRVQGDSMSPTIPNKSYVLIKVQEKIEVGEVGVFLVNDNEEVTLKRLKQQGNFYILVSDNPHYQPIICTNNYPCRTIGKAVSVQFDL